MNIQSLEKSLDYEFRDKNLLVRALTHSSVQLSGTDSGSAENNERLEFLGDSVLQLVLSSELYDRYPDSEEGRLTTMRAALANRKKLAQIARRVGLGEYLILGPTEDSAVGREKPSILGNAIEAVIGAVYLDAGLPPSRDLVLRLFEGEFSGAEQIAPMDNPKGLLQEKIQDIAGETPRYEIISEEGKDHDKFFTASVIWGGRSHGHGRGPSKKSAESAAAQAALDKLSGGNDCGD
ncbi:ribonuclease III [Oscillatoria laete-virens NRMC-F 0139]|nr:ribonuclease III [Oscillatoria laete-virens]MDL5052545.1 ribonuclease III [Oscillatoria laete-virens NRMC-F 0139]